MKQIFILFLAGIFMFSSCEKKSEKPMETERENPLLTEWNTPFGVPPFDQIKSEDYLPALRKGIEEKRADVDAIINNEEAPTFENTVLALELSGKTLTKISSPFYAVKGANTDDVINETAKTLAPEFSKLSDDIRLNPELFAKIDAIYKQKDSLNLDAESLKLLEETHKGFVRAGINLSNEKQGKLRELNSRLAVLTQKFSDNLLKETNSFELHVSDSSDLGNASESLLAVAAKESEKRGHDKGWSFTLSRTSVNPFLKASPNRELRKKIFEGYALRGNNNNEEDNKAILQEIANIRVEKAQLKGYKNHAEFILSDNMAETPEAVYDFMEKLWPAALNQAKKERDALAAKMKSEGINDKFIDSDWRYYVEKVKKEKYNFDEEETRPYFEVNAVRDGVFQLANKLFGLQFKELKNVPKWHEDQQVFEISEADGKHLGIIYLDYYARESKRGGAWMNALRKQSNVGEYITPIVTNNFNFPPATEGMPSLLSFSQAQTFLHEFGHGLHGLFSNVKYRSLGGTSVPRDFVEFPSQIMENWMGEPEFLKLFAKHYQTGEVIPEALVKKMKDANNFGQGFFTVEYMAASYLDMNWHTLEDTKQRECNEFEKNSMEKIGLIEEIIPRYRSTYFQHIFSSGYSAGYYSYLWAEVLDADAFDAFKESGDIFNPEIAKRYRKVISLGGTRKGMELYEEFRGRKPSIEPLIKKRGLN
ncbi:MAG: M3 family metallopeptidase [Bacteroidota bacterium]